MPFLQILGYDVFNPVEVVLEFICDIGIKKGEKIDYAIFRDGSPIILVQNQIRWMKSHFWNSILRRSKTDKLSN